MANKFKIEFGELVGNSQVDAMHKYVSANLNEEGCYRLATAVVAGAVNDVVRKNVLVALFPPIKKTGEPPISYYNACYEKQRTSILKKVEKAKYPFRTDRKTFSTSKQYLEYLQKKTKESALIRWNEINAEAKRSLKCINTPAWLEIWTSWDATAIIRLINKKTAQVLKDKADENIDTVFSFLEGKQ